MLELHTPAEAARWLHGHVTGQLHIDSRKVGPGDGFVAWPGAAVDGRAYVASALRQGATACLVERAGAEAFPFAVDTTTGAAPQAVAAYAGLKSATGLIAAEYYRQPSQRLDVIAITGTNGKTSTAWWLAHALSNVEQTMSIPCGLVGTLGIGMPSGPANGNSGRSSDFDLTSTGMTTPDPVLLQRELRSFVDHGMKACAIEASSIGLKEDRLAGTQIRCAVFTNFTQDHLDYHGNMDAYGQAKAALFQWPGLQAAVLNIDDRFGMELLASLHSQASSLASKPNGGDGAPVDVWTVSCTQPARLQASHIRFEKFGLRFTLTEGHEAHEVASHVMGQFNVSNLLGVIGAMRALGVPLASCVDACQALQPVPGRMAFSGGSKQALVAIDYAHTPDALSVVLKALQPLAQQRGGQLWCVFGCGGDRDASKRPLMGAVAAQWADRVVVTSDNPRSEKPQTIISQILLGLAGHGAVEVQSDRGLAIAYAMASAAPNDVVLIAGKGHETYQEVGGVKLPFSDQLQVEQALQVEPSHADLNKEAA